MAATIRSETEQMAAVVTADQARAIFDRQARRLLSISGDEFLARWDAGEYRDLPDTPDGRRVGYLVLLIPFGRKQS